jgi:hypothetical protein
MKEKDQFEESINKSNETDYEMTQERFDMWLELFDRLGQIVEDYTMAEFIEFEQIWEGKNDRKRGNKSMKLELELKEYIERLDFLKEELSLIDGDDLSDVLDEISEIKICIEEIKEEIEQQKLLEKGVDGFE